MCLIGWNRIMNLILSGLILTEKKENEMKITDFSKMVCEQEGGQKELTIAQVSEVLKIVNEKTNGVLYGVIELMSTTEENV